MPQLVDVCHHARRHKETIDTIPNHRVLMISVHCCILVLSAHQQAD